MSGLAAVELARLHATAGAVVDMETLPPRARRAVAVARAVGAPVAPALDAARAAMRDDEERQRAVRVASAQGRTIAIGLIAAPFLLSPLLGAAAGVDVGAFYRSGTGMAVGLVAGGLLAIGATIVAALVGRAAAGPPATGERSDRRLVRAAVPALVMAVVVHPIVGIAIGTLLTRRRPPTRRRGEVEEAAELMAVASAGGVGFGQMIRVAADQLPSLDDDLRRAALAVELADDMEVPTDLRPVVSVVRAARSLGAPVADTLRAFAADARAEGHAAALEAASRLPAQLTVPTVLFLLPATLLLVGAPLIADAIAALPA